MSNKGISVSLDEFYWEVVDSVICHARLGAVVSVQCSSCLLCVLCTGDQVC